MPAGEVTSPGDHAGIEIEIWALAPRYNRWRVDGPAQAAALVTDFKIRPIGIKHSVLAERFVPSFVSAAQAGEASDITVTGSGDIPALVSAGYIAPFDECRAKYPEFDDVRDNLWELVTWEGKLWGVPLDIEVKPLYFSKTRLRELGWSDEQIAALPERIRIGDFTLDDMLDAARQAIDNGIVDPGLGYWPSFDKSGDFFHLYAAYGGRTYDPAAGRPVVVKDALEQAYEFQRRLIQERITLDKLYLATDASSWTTRLIWRDTVFHERVLFWNSGPWVWSQWADAYTADRSVQADQLERVGYALQPSGIRGRPGHTRAEVSLYVMTSEQASGRTHQAAACALLAKTLTPGINALNAIESGLLGVLKSQADHPAFTQDRRLSEQRYMLDYIWREPWPDAYWKILTDFNLQVESGALSPADAAAAAIEQIQRELGDALIVE